MIAAARKRLPDLRFDIADVTPGRTLAPGT
jgi:trans-aconitate methyltransferase